MRRHPRFIDPLGATRIHAYFAGLRSTIGTQWDDLTSDEQIAVCQELVDLAEYIERLTRQS